MKHPIPLPFGSGTITITQGFNTTASHKDALKWGVDFGMQYFSNVHAVIGGEIVSFRQDVEHTYMDSVIEKDTDGYYKVGSGFGNYITIRSVVGDQTLYTTYAHLQKNFLSDVDVTSKVAAEHLSKGSAPSAADVIYGTVVMGDLIAKLGPTGVRWSEGNEKHRGQHLHMHFGTDIRADGVADGSKDSDLPVYFKAIGLEPDGSLTPPPKNGKVPGDSFDKFVDGNADDYPENASTHGKIVMAPPGGVGQPGADQARGAIEARADGSADADWFAVELTAGVSYSFALRGTDSGATEGKALTLADPTLRIVTANGGALLWDNGSPDADGGGIGRDVLATFTPKTSGTFHLVAFSKAGTTGTYELSGITSDTQTGGDADGVELPHASFEALLAKPGGPGSATEIVRDFVEAELGPTVRDVAYFGSLSAAFKVNAFSIGSAVPGESSRSYKGGLMLSSGGFPGPVNTQSGFSVNHFHAGDPGLDQVAKAAFPGAGATRDASVLSFVVDVPEGSSATTLRVELVFGSEEYPEYVDSNYVDIGAVIVNGVNHALFNGDPTTPLSIVRKNVDPLPDGTFNFINNSTAPYGYGVEWDGFSKDLVIRVQLKPGANTVKIGVADTGDNILDSALYVRRMSLETGGAATGQLLVVQATPPNGQLAASTAAEEFVLSVDQPTIVTATLPALNGDVFKDFSALSTIFIKSLSILKEMVSFKKGSLIVEIPVEGEDEPVSLYFEGELTPDDLVFKSDEFGTLISVQALPTGAPTILGDPRQGEALRVETSTLVDPNGLGPLGYQWLADGEEIDGATGTVLSLAQSEVGREIAVRVSYVDGMGTPEAVFSAQTAAVENVNDMPTGAPVIVGTPRLGRALVAETASIGDVDGPGTFSFQWRADGKAIPGATRASYTPGPAQVDKAISVVVGWTDGFGTAETLTSAETARVALAPIGGTSGPDNLRGTRFDDKMRALGGDDTLRGEAGADRLDGGKGHDRLDGGRGDDRLNGGPGNDTLLGSAGADALLGGGGRDLLFGGKGRDRLEGRGGSDSLDGGAGNDTLLGGAGDDRLNGVAGRDRLDGGKGDDILRGGAGADAFVFRKGYGTDLIADFSLKQNDRLELSSKLWKGARDADSVISKYGTTLDGKAALTFSKDDILIFESVKDLVLIAGQIDIV